MGTFARDVSWEHARRSRRRGSTIAGPGRPEHLESRCLLAANQFAVVGDYGSDAVNELVVSQLVKSWDPGFVITVGDNNYPDGAASTIDRKIGKYYQEFIGNYPGTYGPGSPENRFFPTLGNHDWNTPGATPYFSYFTLPGNERYYDFVQGPVHFFAIDSCPQEPDGVLATSIQATWLRDALAASTSQFNLVYFHHPPYSSGQHGSTEGMRWPFKEWGADLVMAGHDHTYERLLVDGLAYFVNGLGGQDNVYQFENILPESQVRYNGNNGAMLVTMDPDTLTLEFYSVAGGGTLVDDYVIPTRHGPPLPGLSLADISVAEPDIDTVDVLFIATLSEASDQTVTVEYMTRDRNAVNPDDYLQRSGTLTFAPGVLSQTVAVPVVGDTLPEGHRQFYLTLGNPLNARLVRGEALATILDNEAPPNDAPSVDAGPDQSLSIATTSLQGAASDDGVPDVLTTTWTKVSGPGTVSFANPAAVETAVSFGANGAYVLRLTAFDGELTRTDDVTIVVNQPVSVAFQDGVSPTSGYAGTTDTDLRVGSPTNNFGTANPLIVNGSPSQSMLVRWDVSQIPTGSTVQAVTLTFNFSNGTANTYEIYEAKRSWSETQATWNQAAAASGWQSAGAQGTTGLTPDRGATVLGTLTGSSGFSAFNLNAAGLAVVQNWIADPASNFGFVIQDDSATNDDLQIRTREASTVANRPTLTVTYSADPPNGAPSFTTGADQRVNEGAGAQSVPGWATGLSPGPPSESGQTLSFSITGNTNPGLFSAGPSVDSSGNLTYTPAAVGSATISVAIKDDGGTTNGGNETSAAQTFTITVLPVNLHVTTVADSGSGSLRQAILDANANQTTAHTIHFDMSGPGLYQIPLGPSWPAISGAATFRVEAGTSVELTGTSALRLASGAELTKDGSGTLSISAPQSNSAGTVWDAVAGTLNFLTDAGSNLTVNTNSTLNFTGTPHVAALNIASGGMVALSAAGGKVLVTGGLSIAGTGRLDLTDNDLILQATAGAKSAVLADLTAKIASGYGASPPHWQGAGITSSTASADGIQLTSLGIMLNENALGQPIYTTFSGESVTSDSILVKFACFGDANLSGIVDGSDYAMIDNGYNFGLAGWANGDFNYSGSIDGADYALIDNAFNNQGELLAAHPPSIAILLGLNLNSLTSPSHATAPHAIDRTGSSVNSLRDRAVRAAFEFSDAELQQQGASSAMDRGDDFSAAPTREVDDDLFDLLAVVGIAS